MKLKLFFWPQAFPVIETGNLVLRRIVADDQPAVFKGLSDPAVITYYGVEYHSYRDTKLQMDWYDELLQNKTGIWWGISFKNSPDLIGACGFNNIQEQHRKGEIGYWLLPPYWGQGIVKTALSAIIPYAFQELNLHRIEAYVETENTASRHLLERFEFKHEGRLQDCEFKKGRFISLDIFARLHD